MIMSTPRLAAIALLAGVALPAAPLLAPDAARGNALYRTYCASCHGNNPAIGSTVLAAYAPEAVENAFVVIAQMNFLAPLLNDQEVADIAEYIGTVVSPGPPAIQPQTGWYWNPAESGRGFFFEKQNIVFMAGFHYDLDGEATWFTAQGEYNAQTQTLNSPMYLFQGGQTLTGSYRPPTVIPPPSNISLVFTGSNTARLNWAGGTVDWVRMPVAPGGAIVPAQDGAPESGWWWYDQESGRGFAIEFQADYVFMAGFMYADDGEATWYVTNGRMTTPTRYTGPWLAFVDGQTMGGVYRPPTRVLPDPGTVTLAFSDRTHGTMTLPDGRVIPLTRFRF
jgi:cytochrome c553